MYRGNIDRATAKLHPVCYVDFGKRVAVFGYRTDKTDAVRIAEKNTKDHIAYGSNMQTNRIYPGRRI